MVTRCRRALRIEGLEDRRVLSADLVNGVLSVVGTKKSDVIQVDIPSSGEHIGQLAVDVNGVQSFFDVNAVSAIHIFGLNGNDQIAVADDVLIDTWISGGQGKDNPKGGR